MARSFGTQHSPAATTTAMPEPAETAIAPPPGKTPPPTWFADAVPPLMTRLPTSNGPEGCLRRVGRSVNEGGHSQCDRGGHQSPRL